MYRLLNIALLLISVNLFAAEVTLKGIGPTYPNQKFRIDIVTDFLTKKKEAVYAGITDEKGNFTAFFDVKEVKMVFIDFGKAKRTLFVEPGKTYEVAISPLSKQMAKEEGFLAKEIYPAAIKGNDSTELNNLIEEIDTRVARFFMLYGDTLTTSGGQQKIAKFITRLEKYNKYENPYFKQYLKYTIGSFESMQFKAHPEKVRMKYFLTQPMDLNNIQYCGLFQNLFRGYLKYEVALDSQKNIISFMNARQYRGVLAQLSPGNPYNEDFTNLILAYSCVEIQNNPAYQSKSTEILLDSIIRGTSNPQVKVVAENVKAKIFQLQPGTVAPEIVLLDSANHEFKLSNHKGKYVYISFFKSYDNSYAEELKVLGFLQERYKDKLEIVSISTDYDSKQFDKFIDTHNYPWTFLHYQKSEELLMNYHIEDVRTENYERNQLVKWILISPDGKIVYYPAKSPIQGFEYQLKKLIEG